LLVVVVGGGGQSRWKRLDGPELAAACYRRRAPPLVRAPVCAQAAEEALEGELRRVLAAHRREAAGLATQWDDGLGYLLAPALLAYEAERTGGAAAGAAGVAEFQQSVRRAVPAGCTFRGFPMQVRPGGGLVGGG
jgi:hypothetical protein